MSLTVEWRFGLVERVGLDQWSYCVLSPVSAWMGDRLRTGKPSRYVTSYPGRLSLAIPPWVGVMSTGESWGVNGHTARYTSPVSVVSRLKLVSGWGLRKRRSVPPHGHLAREGLHFFTFDSALKGATRWTFVYCSTCNECINKILLIY